MTSDRGAGWILRRDASSSGIQPESSTACCAAATPNRMKSSTLRCSLGSM
jgi:hypothetical protein